MLRVIASERLAVQGALDCSYVVRMARELDFLGGLLELEQESRGILR